MSERFQNKNKSQSDKFTWKVSVSSVLPQNHEKYRTQRKSNNDHRIRKGDQVRFKGGEGTVNRYLVHFFDSFTKGFEVSEGDDESWDPIEKPFRVRGGERDGIEVFAVESLKKVISGVGADDGKADIVGDESREGEWECRRGFGSKQGWEISRESGESRNIMQANRRRGVNSKSCDIRNESMCRCR